MWAKDNAVAERVNNTIKNELLKGMQFCSMGELKAALKVAVEFYNNERPHWSLDGMTPKQASGLKGIKQQRQYSNQIERYIQQGKCPTR